MHQAQAARFENVSKRYRAGLLGTRSVQALADISLSIPEGEVFGLLGPNRAGKTTLVKILLSICRHNRGSITRLGRAWHDRRTLARVGYMHESQAFPRYLSASEVLHYYGSLALVPRSVVRQRAGELLERVGLADRQNEPISRFSKGMLQRLALAQALINDPDLLVLDEPSEGMDLLGRQFLHMLVHERHRAGKTVVLVSHSCFDIAALCTRVAVLRAGKLAFQGTLAEMAGAKSQIGPFDVEHSLETLYAGTAP